MSLEVDENISNVEFQVRVQNIGESQVIVDDCDSIVTFTVIIPEQDEGEFPAQFEHQVVLLSENRRLAIAPGETATVPIVLQWKTTSTLPRMLAVNQVRLVVRYDASFGINTAPVAFVLATDEQALELLPDEQSATDIRDLLRRFPGQASDGVKQLLQTPE